MRLNYLWIEGRVPRLQRACLKSYIQLGYEINLYTFTPDELGVKHKNIFFKDAGSVLDRQFSNHLHYADLFRYILLHAEGGIWIDADMFLLRKIPDDKIIISSQHCNKTGAYKKENTNKTANIGLLKVDKGDILLSKTITKCLKSKAKLGDLSYMNFFIEMIKKLDYEKYVVEPDVYCPIPWANAKELYKKDNREFTSKYGMDVECWECVTQKAIGIHLWNNIYNKKKLFIEENSPFEVLEELVEHTVIDDEIKYCIPTYRRRDIIEKKTLATLSRYNISDENIYIFVENKNEMKPYLDLGHKYNYVITNSVGIGNKRNFIRNYFKNGTRLVMIDDDVEDILFFVDKKKCMILSDLKEFTEMAFKTAIKENVTMWGVCLHDNPFYSQHGYTTNLKFIGGTLQGIIINKISRNIRVDIDHFEDVEFSLKHFKQEGKILRYNDVGLKTKYYHPKGGIVEQKGGVELREEEAWNNATYLLGMYSNNVSLYLKKDGKLNIRLK